MTITEIQLLMEIKKIEKDKLADCFKGLSECPVNYCMKIIGGKWKPIVLFLIFNGINRFGIMQKNIEGISKQMLTKQLRELELDNVLTRKIYAEIPPRVEYFLTEKGKSLCPIIKNMKIWGEKNMISPIA